MARTGLGVCALLLFAGVNSRPQRAPVEPRIRVIVPHTIDLDHCRFEYLLGGSFGGYGGRAVPNRDLPGYEIEMIHDGAAVETVSAFLACIGYQVVPVVSGSLPEAEHRTF